MKTMQNCYKSVALKNQGQFLVFKSLQKLHILPGGWTSPEGLHTFGGTDFFGHMSKKGWSQSTQLANIWKSLHHTRP